MFSITLGFCIVFSSDATLDYKVIHFCLSLKVAFGTLIPSKTLVRFCIVFSSDATLDFRVILWSVIDGGLLPPYS